MTSPGRPCLLRFRAMCRLPRRLLAQAQLSLTPQTHLSMLGSPERHPIPHHQPAGRSWMERIGSHSVVVVLLLVVIAAGLVIGRNSRNQGIDSSLADSSDLLDFDEGTELDLPLPKHVYNQPTNIATTAKAELSAQSQESRVSGLESFDAPTVQSLRLAFRQA